jgi:MSHA biogenesis protein MshE
MKKPDNIRLGEILLNQKLISEGQLQIALQRQRRTGGKLGRVFIDSGLVGEEALCDALAKQFDIAYVQLRGIVIRPETIALLPEIQARRFRAIALREERDSVLIGMADPTDLFAYDEITRLLKRDITMAVVNERELLEMIDRLYRRTGEISGLARELEQDLDDNPIDFGEISTTSGLEDAPVVKLLQSVFDDAAMVGASDIHIEPQEKRLHIRFRIDGVLHLQTEADIRIAAPLALRLKLVAHLDISEKRIPHDGRFTIKVKQHQIDVRISTMPTQYGESVVMRLLSQRGGILDLDRIGMPTAMLARFRSIIQRPNGLVLVTGPTGSGKTTTLYGALAELNTMERKLITVEDPVEYRLHGVNQVQVNEKIDLSFARVLRSALRQDPDVVLVGEIRDTDTAQISLRAAMTGHLVLSTLHTNDAMSTPMRLLDMGVPGYMVGSALQAVVAQRLVRVICDSCKEDHTLLANERAWLARELGTSVDSFRYSRGRGCSHCNNTGFHGRAGVYEMLEMTDELVAATHGNDAGSFRHIAKRQMAGESLSRHVIALATAGKTTVSEAMFVGSKRDDN